MQVEKSEKGLDPKLWYLKQKCESLQEELEKVKENLTEQKDKVKEKTKEFKQVRTVYEK